MCVHVCTHACSMHLRYVCVYVHTYISVCTNVHIHAYVASHNICTNNTRYIRFSVQYRQKALRNKVIIYGHKLLVDGHRRG